MNDKVIIDLIVPEVAESFNIFLPINKKMGTIVKLLCKAINELTNGDFPITANCKLYNSETLQVYEPNVLLFNTDIRNGTKLVLLTK